MFRSASAFVTGSLFAGAAIAASIPPAPTVTELYRFPNATFIENIIVRSDGQLVLSTFDQGRVYIFDPSADEPEPYVLAKIPTINKLTGIAEVAPHVYAVSGGDESGGWEFVNGTTLVATINLDGCGGDAPSINIATRMPEVQLLNGMATLAPSIVLSADSLTGRIYRTNTATGEYDIAFQDDALAAGPNEEIPPLGANGLLIRDGYLYYTNSNRQTFGRVPITEEGDQAGEAEEIYRMPPGSMNAFDDFTITSGGVAYITSQTDSLVRVTPDGQATTLIGPDSDFKLDSPASVELSVDEKTVNVVTGVCRSFVWRCAVV
jgi:hypothetical protein